jgi:hypothetical protein
MSIGNEINKRKNWHWLTEGMIIASVPFLGYLYVFTFELGFTSYFHMPIELISPSLNYVYLFSLLIIFSGLIFIFYFDYFYSGFIDPVSDGPIVRFFKKVWPYVFLYSFFLVAFMTLFFGRRGGYSPWAILYIVFCVSIWLLTEMGRKDLGIVTASLKVLSSNPRISFGWAGGFDNRKSVIVFLIIGLMLMPVYSFGQAAAKSRDHFLVFYRHKNKIILRIYGDNAICVGFDKLNKEIDGKFEIIKLCDGNGGQFGLESIGRLTGKKLTDKENIIWF